MQSEQVIDILRQAMKTAVMLSAPLLAFALVVGVLTNVFQAVTQISETTVQMVPKLLAMLLALLLFAPWMLDVMIDFTTQMYDNIPLVIR